MTLPPPTIGYLSNIYFEAGAIRLLPALLDQLNVNRPLVVTDPGVIAAGLADKLPIDQPIVFDGVGSNPDETSVSNGIACYREHQCDGIIAIGGGSPIDAAKAIGLLVHHTPPLSQYAFVNGGLAKITAKRPPLIAIPTTAGTGSEVGRAALITFSNGTKLGLLSPHLIPSAAICDPELTLGLPPMLTAATGMDAISHCVETYCSPKYNPVADAIALDGLRRACAHITAAVNDGSNIEHRREMMMAALQGALAFQKGLGVIHSLSHPLGALESPKLHHGTLNAIFLPHALRFNAASCPKQMQAIADAIGLKRADDLPDFFSDLSQQISLPACLSDMGLTADQIEPLVPLAAADHCSATNPRSITEDDCRDLFHSAL